MVKTPKGYKAKKDSEFVISDTVMDKKIRRGKVIENDEDRGNMKDRPHKKKKRKNDTSGKNR